MPWNPPSSDDSVTSVFGRQAIGGAPWYAASGGAAVAASAVWPTANSALFVPFCVRQPRLVQRLWWYNGATASGNVDCGIYSADGTLLVSAGSTAQGTINVLQSVDITDTLIGPGQFYMALVMDNITGTMFRATSNSGARIIRLLGTAMMATAFPLPAVATLASDTLAFMPVFGNNARAVL